MVSKSRRPSPQPCPRTEEPIHRPEASLETVQLPRRVQPHTEDEQPAIKREKQNAESSWFESLSNKEPSQCQDRRQYGTIDSAQAGLSLLDNILYSFVSIGLKCEIMTAQDRRREGAFDEDSTDQFVCVLPGSDAFYGGARREP